MNRVVLLTIALLTACTSEPDTADAPGKKSQDGKVTLVSKQPTDAARAAEQACTRLTFENVLLTHCVAHPARHRIRTALGPEGAPPYRGLGALAQARTGQQPHVAFAMNGGMFDDRGQPIGYYVEGGHRLARLNRNDGPGNFHLKPNGVFYGTGGTWAVRTSGWFAEHVSQRPDFATQSGPMLVIDGAIHPRFDEDGESKFIRNAVGVSEDGRAHFVISEMPISFGKLARFYRDELKVPDALYLDGNVSALWYPMGARIDASPPLGPLIVVEKRAKAVARPSTADDVDDKAHTGSKDRRMILVIDNYDSFTFNLVHYLMELGAEVEVVRNDAMSAAQALSSGAQGFLISPGPCTPNEAGISLELVAKCAEARRPLLGVCLGHQAIGQAFGGKVGRGGLMHGKTSPVSHDGTGVFTGLPSPFAATRYHSLVVRDIPAELVVNATSDDGFVMGFRHESLPIHGVQFHPESIATEHGHDLLANFLQMCGIEARQQA